MIIRNLSKEVNTMAYPRKKAENLDEVVGIKKKFVRYDEGAQLFSMGIHTFEKIAKDAGAVYRVNKLVLINVEIVEEYMETFREESEYID